jgi:hypothetical protein
MRKLFFLGAVLAAVAFPAASHAQASKFTLGLRLGYAPAMGDAAKDFALSDAMKSQIPLQVDAAFKVTPEVAVGAYLSYGFGQAGSLPVNGTNLCDLSGVDCAASDTRLGIEAFYTFTQVTGQFVPWVAVGTGWEWASTSAEDASGKFETSYNGWEYLNLQVGGDWKVSPNFGIGPYVMYSMGQYGDATVKFAGQTLASGSIDNKAMHEWLSFGVIGKFDL